LKTSLLITLIMALFLAACAPVAPAPAAVQPTVETQGPAPTAVPTQAAQPTPAPTEAPAPAPTQASAAPALTANPWQWAGFTSPTEQFKLDQPGNYLVTFQSDGTVAIKADCNNASGTYTADASSLTIQVGPATMAACPSGSRSEQLIKLLGGAAKYFFVDKALFISLYADGGVMRFDPAGGSANAGKPAATAEAAPANADALAAAFQMVGELTANPWKWIAYSAGSEQGKVETPANYTLTFQTDGTVAIKADCNDATGSWTVEGTDITMKVGPVTLAACPPGSHSDQFLQLLGEAAQLLPAGGKLYINLKADGDTMQFDPAITTVADLCGDKALAINKIDDTLDPKLSAMLDEGLVSLVKGGTRPGPGAVMLIITPNGRYLKSTGVADVKTCEPLKADSPFQIGSNTKMMTAAMIYQLQEEGKLSTSDLLSKWLPDLAAKLPNGEKMTIEMMLTHTTGMKDYFEVQGKDGSIADGAKDKAILTRAFTPEELVKTTANSGLSEFAPAAEGQWKYNNTGYILLGLIIEKATGKSYEENLKTRIFEPLGLKQTYLQTGVPQTGALPNAYYQTPFDFATGEWNASQGWSAGAVVSTPDEFATFMKALFTGRLFKQPETLKLMETPAPTSANRLGPGVTYAHGMSNNNGVLGHGGQTLGFQSDGGYIPDKDVTIVMWSNAAESNVSRLIVPALAGAVTGGGQ
jgi:D-alanyl-D-alanine carboxypeptidase